MKSLNKKISVIIYHGFQCKAFPGFIRTYKDLRWYIGFIIFTNQLNVVICPDNSFFGNSLSRSISRFNDFDLKILDIIENFISTFLYGKSRILVLPCFCMILSIGSGKFCINEVILIAIIFNSRHKTLIDSHKCFYGFL